jgi:hypothetical protein
VQRVDALAIRLRPRAPGLAPADVEPGLGRADRAGQAIDPAEAERLLDDGVVRQGAWAAGLVLVIDHPHRLLAVVVRREPGAPRRAVAGIELGRVLHVTSSAGGIDELRRSPSVVMMVMMLVVMVVRLVARTGRVGDLSAAGLAGVPAAGLP